MANAAASASPPQQEEIDINLDDPQVGEAAKKIQNVFRNRNKDKKATAAKEPVATDASAKG